MFSFGLVGVGKFGSRVRRVLEDESNVDLVWVATSVDDPCMLSRVDWVYICSSNECHYENALAFMRKGCSVILEKPPTLSLEALENLIEKASEYGVEIFFSMVYLFDSQVTQIKSPSKFEWQKSIIKPVDDSAFAALVFHHIYIFIRNMKSIDINKLKPRKVYFNSPEDFAFELWSSKKEAEFQYLRSPTSTNNHKLDDNVIRPGKPDTLAKMLNHILENLDVNTNKILALHALNLLEKIRLELFPTKVVIGAGIFGCTTAIALSNKGYNVDLIERNSQIMQEASSINQYRVHRGYHYPRSAETVSQCAKSFPIFEKKYSQAIVDKTHHTNSYYAIASENSKVTSNEYTDFLHRHGLKFKQADIGLKGVSNTFEVTERLYDPIKLKEIVADRLHAMGVNVVTDKVANNGTLAEYSGGVIATYANQGYWDKSQVNYQFELCEKPIAKLPKRYEGMSVVIMDGPFMCIDPYSDTGLHVMGNVVHAIHTTSYGDRPIIPEEYNKLLNKGCVTPPRKLTNFELFIKSASKFFPEIVKAEHIGSMYTIRAVECNRDHDDARLTKLNKLDENFYKIFSGKVCTSVGIAKKVVHAISESEETLSLD